MMKITLFLALAIFGSAQAGLKEDIREIIALVPKEQIREVTLRYYQNDADFQRVVAYLRGGDFKQIVGAVANNEAWQDFKVYLSNSGLEINRVIDRIRELLGFNAARNINIATSQVRSVRGWYEEVRALVPVDEIRALIRDKIATSADFQDFIARIRSPEFQTLVRAVHDTPEYQDLLTIGREHGVDVDKWIEKLYNFFGWTKP